MTKTEVTISELIDKKQALTKGKQTLRILESLFAVKDRTTLAGKIIQILSHFTWELPQQITGVMTAEFVNVIGGIKNSYFKNGVLVLECKFMDQGMGYALGNILTVGLGSSQKLIAHEYGHYMQSRIFGPGYIPLFAIPSFVRASVLSAGRFFGQFRKVNYDAFYTERYATKLGQMFWGKG